MKSLIYLSASVTPAIAVADTSFDIALACAGGAVISAIFKYREAASGNKHDKIAVADAVLAAACGMTVGWFAHPIGVGVIERFAGFTVSAALAALVLSLLGIKIVELVMSADIKSLLPGGKGKKSG